MKKVLKILFFTFILSSFFLLTSCIIDKPNLDSNDKDSNADVEVNENEDVLYKINYELNGGSFGTIPNQTFVNYNAVVLPIPIKETCKFLGWYEDDVLIDSISENRDYNLSAKWENGIEIIYNNLSNENNLPNLGYSGSNSPLNKEYLFLSDLKDGDVGIRSSRSVVNNQYRLYNPTLFGFEFMFWSDSFTDEEVTYFDEDFIEQYFARTDQSEYIELNAHWTTVDKTITLYSDNSYDDVYISYDYTIVDIVNDSIGFDLKQDFPKIPGKFFVGWYYKDSLTRCNQFSVYDFSDIELYPIYVDQIDDYCTYIPGIDVMMDGSEYYVMVRTDGGLYVNDYQLLTVGSESEICSFWYFSHYYDNEEETYKAGLFFDEMSMNGFILDMTYVELVMFDDAPYSVYKFKFSDITDDKDYESWYGKMISPICNTHGNVFLVRKK